MNVTLEVTPDKIADQVVAAFEGGSNYWLREARLVSSEHITRERPWYAGKEIYGGKFAIKVRYDNPDSGSRFAEKVITQDDLQAGLTRMAKDDPRHMADLLSEDFDATTADVFMQHVVLGSVVYG